MGFRVYFNSFFRDLEISSKDAAGFLSRSAIEVHVVGLVALNAIACIFNPLPYFIGFTVSIGVSNFDLTFNSRIVKWFNSFFSESEVSRINVISVLSLIILSLSPASFAFCVGFSTGKKFMDEFNKLVPIRDEFNRPVPIRI